MYVQNIPCILKGIVPLGRCTKANLLKLLPFLREGLLKPKTVGRCEGREKEMKLVIWGVNSVVDILYRQLKIQVDFDQAGSAGSIPQGI